MKKTILTLCAVAGLSMVNFASASIIFDDFNATEGHFASNPSASGTTVGLDGAQSTIDRVTTGEPFEGIGHQELVLV
ncbi:MAG: hypothetical protein ABJC04_02640, partial [Verrucomicrobiota bacterium]